MQGDPATRARRARISHLSAADRLTRTAQAAHSDGYGVPSETLNRRIITYTIFGSRIEPPPNWSSPPLKTTLIWVKVNSNGQVTLKRYNTFHATQVGAGGG